jgi:ABC-type glycerol-3-phosphate transport system permease component
MLLLFNGQDVVWPLLVNVSPERYTLNVTLLRLAGMFSGAESMLAAAMIFFVLPVCVFFFISLALFQVFYLDRLMLYAENPSTEKAT